MQYTSIIFGLIGGLALFLYGLFFLSEGLQKVAGGKVKKMLERLTDRPLKGVFVGAFTTGVTQSSSVMMVTIIGLINAGLLTLEQAVGVMLGAEIGTTITAQLIAFRIGTFYLPLIAIGFFLYSFSHSSRNRYIGQAILGFGILFLGMAIMKDGVKPFRNEPYILDILANFGKTPIIGIIIGALFTGIVQSSSATTGLVIAMGMENVLTLPAAIALIFGANIGTTVTGLLASIGSNLPAKRTAAAQFIVNISGVAIFVPFISKFAALIATTSPDLPRQIANAHTVFNVTVTLLMLPLVGVLVVIVKKVVPGEEIQIDRGTKYLDDRTLNAPAIALSQVQKEAVNMGKTASEMLDLSIKALENGDPKIFLTIKKKEEGVDEVDNLIEKFLTKIGEKDLSEDQMKFFATLQHSITDIERVADHANNLAEQIQKMHKKKITFSSHANEELHMTYVKVKDAFEKAIKVLEHRDEELGRNVLDIEREIDVLEKEFEENHYKRLERGECKPDAGPIFIDMLRNLERISDHAHNIVNAVLIGF
jgi:phosphate:Na+ symporter